MWVFWSLNPVSCYFWGISSFLIGHCFSKWKFKWTLVGITISECLVHSPWLGELLCLIYGAYRLWIWVRTVSSLSSLLLYRKLHAQICNSKGRMKIKKILFTSCCVGSHTLLSFPVILNRSVNKPHSHICNTHPDLFCESVLWDNRCKWFFHVSVSFCTKYFNLSNQDVHFKAQFSIKY